METNNIKLKAIAIHRRSHRNEVWVLPIFLTRINKDAELKATSEGNAQWLEIDDVKKMDKVLPSAKYYLNHVLNDRPGVMYTNLIWDDKGLVEESSRTIDRDY